MDEYIIFDTQPGGIGKNVMSTSVISALKKKYDEKRKIIVISPYPEIFINNSDIYRIYKSSCLQYFYDDFIKDKNTLIFKCEPYNNTDYIYGRVHLIDSWYQSCGLEDFSIESTRLNLTIRELQYCVNKYKIGNSKKIAIFQPFGGASNLSTPYDWARDIPIGQANEIVQRLLIDNYTVYQIRSSNNILLNGCIDICDIPIRELVGLIAISDRRILIDSCCQHIAAALNLQSTVLWIINRYKNLGYKIHKNICVKSKKEFCHNIESYFEEYDWTGQLHYQYPYEDMNLFDIDEIIEND